MQTRLDMFPLPSSAPCLLSCVSAAHRKLFRVPNFNLFPVDQEADAATTAVLRCLLFWRWFSFLCFCFELCSVCSFEMILFFQVTSGRILPHEVTLYISCVFGCRFFSSPCSCLLNNIIHLSFFLSILLFSFPPLPIPVCCSSFLLSLGWILFICFLLPLALRAHPHGLPEGRLIAFLYKLR